MNFAQRLKQLRKSQTISEKDLAARFGITPRAWRFYEQGSREPNIELLIKIADYFDVSLDFLVGREER